MKIEFQNTLGISLGIQLDGRLKANLDPGESISLEVANTVQRVTFIGETAYAAPGAQIQQTQPAPATTQSPAAQPRSYRPGNTAGLREKRAVIAQLPDGSIKNYNSVTAAAADHSLPWFEISDRIKNGTDYQGVTFRHAASETDTAGHQVATKLATSLAKATPTTGIIQFTREGKKITAFHDRASACQMAGVDPEDLDKALRGDAPYAGGSIWKEVKATA